MIKCSENAAHPPPDGRTQPFPGCLVRGRNESAVRLCRGSELKYRGSLAPPEGGGRGWPASTQPQRAHLLGPTGARALACSYLFLLHAHTDQTDDARTAHHFPAAPCPPPALWFLVRVCQLRTPTPASPPVMPRARGCENTELTRRFQMTRAESLCKVLLPTSRGAAWHSLAWVSPGQLTQEDRRVELIPQVGGRSPVLKLADLLRRNQMSLFSLVGPGGKSEEQLSP